MPMYRVWLYRAEGAAALVSAASFVLTLVDPQWIERWFDESPDGGAGSFERWIVGGGFLVAALIAGVLARRERHGSSAATAIARRGD